MARWGLFEDPAATDLPNVGRSTFLLCRKSDRTRVLLKAPRANAAIAVAREAGALSDVVHMLAGRPASLKIPGVLGDDPQAGVLAIEWFERAENLLTYHGRTRRFGHVLARQIGRAVAFVHRLSHPDEHGRYKSLGRQQVESIKTLLYISPRQYAELSTASIQLYSAIHQEGPAMQALFEMMTPSDRECLLHGDLKQANILRLEDGRLAFVDWELASWGDPARDLGNLLACYVLGWLVPAAERPAITQGTLRSYWQTLLGAYRAARGRRFALEADFETRMVKWCGLALLYGAYAATLSDASYPRRARSIAQHAFAFLREPERWSEAIFGAA